MVDPNYLVQTVARFQCLVVAWYVCEFVYDDILYGYYMNVCTACDLGSEHLAAMLSGSHFS